jgi:hypothetical protein
MKLVTFRSEFVFILLDRKGWLGVDGFPPTLGFQVPSVGPSPSISRANTFWELHKLT